MKKIMTIRRIATKIITSLYFIAIVVIMEACDTGQGMMHGSNSIGTDNWNWLQILISLGLGILLGFVLCLAISRKRW
jgi:hypothetical protein